MSSLALLVLRHRDAVPPVFPRGDHNDAVGCDDVDLLLHAALLCQGCCLWTQPTTARGSLHKLVVIFPKFLPKFLIFR
jgi:hypothetical protein